MNKTTTKILIAVIILNINICAVPLAAFSLFATPEGTSIFSTDYLLAAAILMAADLVMLVLLCRFRPFTINLYHLVHGAR